VSSLSYLPSSKIAHVSLPHGKSLWPHFTRIDSLEQVPVCYRAFLRRLWPRTQTFSSQIEPSGHGRQVRSRRVHLCAKGIVSLATSNGMIVAMTIQLGQIAGPSQPYNGIDQARAASYAVSD